MDRRKFLKDTALASIGLGGAAFAQVTQGKTKVAQNVPRQEKLAPIIDTHIHCFAGADNPRFPFHERAPYRPVAAATPQHLLMCMDGAGVDSGIIVHPEPYQDDHRYLEYCLGFGDGRLKGTCLFFADQPGSLSRMSELVRKLPGRIVAARVHAYAPGRLPPFGKPELRALWKTATDLGLAMQIHFEPRYASGFEPLIREFRETTVIIDHLGRPYHGTPEEYDRILAWSRFPNTVMKVAAIPAQENYPHRNITPVIRQLTNAYGAERMIYGGGFDAGATPESYLLHRENIKKHLAHISEREVQMILGGTAARLFGFG